MGGGVIANSDNMTIWYEQQQLLLLLLPLLLLHKNYFTSL